MSTRIYEKKQGRAWVELDRTSDETIINKSLVKELISKYIYKGSWVKRITLNYYFSPDQNEIIVTFDNGYRHVYHIDK